ncbi:unnamed protein product [Linum trigynum]|uniref:Uncharacterized protein n=1 Tax=Linum trigynum TaxID=586398 RepID=A0AAV2EZD6_9ROSI
MEAAATPSALRLHHTLSGSNKRLKAMEDGTTSMTKSSKNAPERIPKLEGFGASYSSLAERCDHLLSLNLCHESSSMSRGASEDQVLAAESSYPPDAAATDNEIMVNLITQPMHSQGTDDREPDLAELKFQVAKLMEENLWQQAELARRNVEKKVTISRLQSQVEHLKRQNMALQDSISFYEMGKKNHRSSTSKLHQLWDKLCRREYTD